MEGGTGLWWQKGVIKGEVRGGGGVWPTYNPRIQCKWTGAGMAGFNRKENRSTFEEGAGMR